MPVSPPLAVVFNTGTSVTRDTAVVAMTRPCLALP